MPRKYLNRPATPEEISFMQSIFNGPISSPNIFTKGMGDSIREAREEAGFSQVEFANKLGSNQSTISDIEKGKNEIGVLTLAKIAMILKKPIDYFFPESLISSIVTDIQNEGEERVLLLFREIGYIGDQGLAINILTSIRDYFSTYLENKTTNELDQ